MLRHRSGRWAGWGRRPRPGSGLRFLLAVLARVFGLGFLVGGALGVRTGVRAERRAHGRGVSGTTAESCADPVLRVWRRRVRRAARILLGREADDADATGATDAKDGSTSATGTEGSGSAAADPHGATGTPA